MIFEIASFKLLEVADEGTFLAEHKKVHDMWVTKQPGYISRSTTKSAAGEWRDIIKWNSLEQAHDASGLIIKSPEAGPWMSLMDPESIKMYHGEEMVMLE